MTTVKLSSPTIATHTVRNGLAYPMAATALESNAIIDRTGGVDGDFVISADQITSGSLNDSLITESSVTQHQGALELSAAQITSGTLASDRISQASVTQHQGALSLGAAQVTSGEFEDARISESSVTQHALPIPSVNAQAGDYTLTAADVYDAVTVDSALPETVTIPTGLTGHVDIWQLGVGTVTVEGAAGVTVNGSDGGSDMIGTQYTWVRAQSIAADTWIVG